MDDEVLMSEADGVADCAEQLQPLADGESIGVTVLVNGYAIDELHHKVGIAFFGAAAVEQSSDVRMFEAGENLAFCLESCYRKTGSKSTLHQLDGHPFLILIICAHRHEDGSHTAFSDLSLNQVRSNPAAYPGLRRFRFLPRFCK